MPKRKLPPDQEVIYLYLSGMSGDKIAKMFGMANGSHVTELLRKNGIEIRHRKVKKIKCKFCEREIKKISYRTTFCSQKCKSEWQTTQKPATKEWLYQKYFVEKLSCYQIAKIVKRNPKNVWRWFNDYGFKLKYNRDDIYKINIKDESKNNIKNENDNNIKKEYIPIISKNFNNKEWLYNRYVIEKHSAKEIADELMISRGAVYSWLEKHNILRRTTSSIHR